MKRVLCVWLPNWPLQRLLIARPELRDRPVVLYRATRRGLRVLTCSSIAARRGVTVGLPVAEARGLFQAPRTERPVDTPRRHGARQRARGSQVEGDAPAACFVEHDACADLRALEQLAVWCQRFSPTVGFEEFTTPSAASPSAGDLFHDTLLLDITGCAHLFQGEERLAARIGEDFRRRELLVEVAIADTIGAAWAAARFSPRPAARDGSRVIPPGRQESFLKDFPIAALRLDPRTLRIFGELDIRVVGQLRALPRASLPSRFGDQVASRIDQVLGRVAERIVPFQPAPRAEASQTFEHPLCHREALATVLRQLLEQLVDQLQRRGQAVQGLLVRLDGGDRDHTQFSLGFVGPCRSSAYLAEMVLARLELQQAPREVTAARVQATVTAPVSKKQAGLFPESVDAAGQKQFGQLIDRLSTRLGERAVLAARLLPDARPEHAYCWEPFARRRESLPEPFLRPWKFFFARPIWLKQRPPRITVRGMLADGPPACFRWEGRDHDVVRGWGPERIETGWWRPNPVLRDYYRVETSEGHQFWLFRQLHSGTWYLHGVF